ncbi:MAG: TraM recognition domain-containing protein [Phycisphaerales bacterium]
MPREELDLLDSVQITRDPYNYGRVAKDHARSLIRDCGDMGLGVDFRSESTPEDFAHSLTIIKLTAIPVIALAVVLVARVLSPWTTSFFALGLLTTVSLGLAIYQTAFTEFKMVGPRPIARFVGLAAVGPLAWLLLTLSTALEAPTIAVGLPFLIVIAVAVLFADDVADHFVSWTAASPRVPDRVRRSWLRAWRTRWQARAAEADAPAPLGPVLRGYATQVLLVAAAYIVALILIQFVPRSVLGHLIAGSVAVLVFWVVLALVSPDPRTHSVRLVLRAIVNYITYTPEALLAPGVFRSPAGSGPTRYSKFALVLAAATFTIPPMALYFPIGVLASEPAAWHRAAERTEWIESVPDRAQEQQVDTRPSRAEVRSRLTDAQKAYMEALPGQRARNAYLDTKRGAAPSGAPGPSPLVAVYVTRTPETWLVLAFVGLSTVEPVFIWSLLLSLVLSLTVPAATVFLVVYAVAARPINAFHDAFGTVDATHTRRSGEPTWKEYAERLRASPSALAREHLWLGTSGFGDYPVLLHRRALEEHVHILGDTGSGKTSRGLAPIVSQLIASGRRTPSYPGHSVVVIDLKGEPYFFNSTRVDARAAGLPFRWFTNVNGESTYVFNPFLQSHVQGLTTNQFAEVLLQSLGLEYGEAYGPSHFSRMNRRVLQKVMQIHSEQGRGELDSFRSLEDVLTSRQIPFSKEEQKDATDVFAVIESLAKIDAINITQRDVESGRVAQSALDAAIDMTSFLTEPQVGYFYFSSTLETSTVREVSKLVLFSLLTAADALERAHGPGHRVYVVIDEFQQIIANNLELVLRQARSKNISCILANQSISDLKSGAIDVIPTVQANTRVRQYFAASDLNQQELIEKSGGHIHQHQAFTQHPIESLALNLGPLGEIYGDTVIAGQVSRDEVIAMTDDPDACILHITRGSGLTQFSGYPLLMKTDYHVSKRRFDRWKRKPWPKQSPKTIVTPLPTMPERRSGSPVLDEEEPNPSVARIEAAKRNRRRRQERGD